MVNGNTKLAALMKLSNPIQAWAERTFLDTPGARRGRAELEGTTLGGRLRKAIADNTINTYTYGAKPIDSLPVKARPPALEAPRPTVIPAAPHSRGGLDVANLARQIARQSGFRPTGKGDFSDEASANRFMSRNPNFTNMALKKLIGG